MDLLNSTGNCTQYFVITCKGRESEEEHIYLNSCTIYLKLTQYCKTTILQVKNKNNLKN